MIKTILLLSVVSNYVTGQTGCALTDVACLSSKAQFTVIGTVQSTNLNTTPGISVNNYNASLYVQCVLASFSNPISSAAGLANQLVTVTRWGVNNPACPSGKGSTAVVGTPYIYFIAISKAAPYGSSIGQALYTVQDPCAGGVPYNATNIQTISNLLATNPNNAVPASYVGTDPSCPLPAPTATLTLSIGTSSTNVVLTNGGVPTPSSPSQQLISLLTSVTVLITAIVMMA